MRGLSANISRFAVVVFLSVGVTSQATEFNREPTDAPILYEDFSGPGFPASFELFNPYPPWASGHAAMNVFVDEQELVFEHDGGFGVAVVLYEESFDIRDTSVEAVVRTSNEVRSLASVEWRLPSVLPSDSSSYISWGLQADENKGYLFVIEDNAVTVMQTAPVDVIADVSNHLELEIVGESQIRGYVDGNLLVDLQYDLSEWPELRPGVGVNSKSTNRKYFDDWLVRSRADEDEDGVYDVFDVCPGTDAEEDLMDGPAWVRWGVNRNLVMEDPDGRLTLYQNTKRNGPVPFGYQLHDTEGCSCGQILEACEEDGFGYGVGHFKFGCSNSVIETWVEGTGTSLDGRCE
jgi:hypothetical protein